MTPLPLDSHWHDVVFAIMAAQRRCRIGLVGDPFELAQRACAQASRLRQVAAVLGVAPALLHPVGQFYQAADGLRTVVVLDHRGLTVERCLPTSPEGRIRLTIWSSP